MPGAAASVVGWRRSIAGGWPAGRQCLLSLEVCSDKHLEAIGTSGELWKHIQNPCLKLVCAELAAIAMILAGRPESRWARYRDFLATDRTRITQTSWCFVEIEAYLKELESRSLDPGRLAATQGIHRLLLSHLDSQADPQ